MKQIIRHAVRVLIACLCLPLSGQTPFDAILMKKGEICLALDYQQGAWDQYWEGTYLRSNGNIATLHRTAIAPMAVWGITDRINLLVGLPYIATRSSEPNGGYMSGARGFQDISADLKIALLQWKTGQSKLTLLANGGFAAPASRYLSDYAPYNIGLGTTEFSARAILQYRFGWGLYLRASAAHLWRGYTTAERDYYYNNGSYYTSLMDVPHAWNYHGAIGWWLWKDALQLEINHVQLTSTSGDDIRPYNAGQPTNRVEFSQAGAKVHYYFQTFLRGWGLYAYHSRMYAGRNMGAFIQTGGGVTYLFQINPNQEKNEN